MYITLNLHLILSFNLPDMFPSFEGILKQDILDKWTLMRRPQGSHCNLSVTFFPPICSSDWIIHKDLLSAHKFSPKLTVSLGTE